MIHVKRVYDAQSAEDGFRILVDRLWPRGLTKESAGVDLWMKEVAPSTDLRKWFHADPSAWKAFRQKYAKEVALKPDLIAAIRKLITEHRVVTFLYASRDVAHNHAEILKELVTR